MRAVTLLMILLTASCVGLGPSQAAAQATDGGADEAELWRQSAKIERKIKSSRTRVRDPDLTAGVQGVLCKLAPEFCSDLRVYILRRPAFNAAAAPNGYVEVNSGLLLRVRNEDELAFVLGHEVSHFARKHALAEYRQHAAAAGQQQMFSTGIAILATAARYSNAASGKRGRRSRARDITDTATVAEKSVGLMSLASIFGFSRQEETEADRLGLERSIAAGYRPVASTDLWGHVTDEARASDFPEVRRADARGSIFSTHPITAERIAALKGLGATGIGPDLAAARKYRAMVRPQLPYWLQDELGRRDFGQMLFLLDGLSGEGEDAGLIAFYRGETLRQRGHPGDVNLALAAYRAATEQADTPVAAWRQRGELSREVGDIVGARAAFSTYLEKVPDAADRSQVESLLRSLKSPSG